MDSGQSVEGLPCTDFKRINMYEEISEDAKLSFCYISWFANHITFHVWLNYSTNNMVFIMCSLQNSLVRRSPSVQLVGYVIVLEKEKEVCRCYEQFRSEGAAIMLERNTRISVAGSSDYIAHDTGQWVSLYSNCFVLCLLWGFRKLVYCALKMSSWRSR